MAVKEVCNSLTHDRLLRWLYTLKEEAVRVRNEIAARGEGTLQTDAEFQASVVAFISSHYDKLLIVNRAMEGQVVFVGCTPIAEVLT
jgi:hypothetical protein